MATKKFKCKVCGYVHEGDKAPEQCPMCQAPQSEFEEIVEEGAAPAKKGLNTSDNRFMEMSDFVRQVIVRRLEQIPEVAMVDVSGQVYPQLLVIPDMEKLRAIGADENQLSNAIRSANVSLGSLSIRDGEYRFDVRFESSVVTREDVENVWLKLGGRTYQIKELAEAREVAFPKGVNDFQVAV